MRTNTSMYLRQRGSSVIELPIITLIMVVLVLFIVKVNQGINQKNQLDNLAYSLTSIAACAECDNTMPVAGTTGLKPRIISIELADSLLLVAQRFFNALIVESSAEIGLSIEQVVFDPATQKARLYDVNTGAECLSAKPLLTLTDLSPLGTTQGLNAGQYAELFQVTLCIKGGTRFGGDFSPVLLSGFSDRYYQSSALLIGRTL